MKAIYTISDRHSPKLTREEQVMLQPWNDYEKAIESLENDPREELTRNEATALMGMSTGAFSREVKDNQMFLAKCEPRLTGRASYYSRKDLIDHMKRLKKGEEPALLLYERTALSDDAFLEKYGKTTNQVFRKGSYLTVGGYIPTEEEERLNEPSKK